MSLDFGQICSAVSDTAVPSLSNFFWTAIKYLWPWHWLGIVLIFGGWIAWEFYTRNGTAHYNSDNGFSPTFNRFVGSGTYLGLQTLVFLILTTVFGNYVYCLKWPVALHVLIFLSSGLLLNLTGFWVYLKEPGRRRKRYRRSRH
jgi:hypothetical protein